MSDDVVPAQIENIERFLESNNMDYTVQRGVYRHIGNSRREDYFSSPRVEPGNEVHFYVAGYRFERSRMEPAFFSNKDFIIEELKEAGLSDVYWQRDIMVARLGKSDLVKGIERGLPGCRQGDSVRMFMPSDLAFGENYISTLPLNSAVEYVLWIDKVIK